MIITAIAWFYISFICLTWGILMIEGLKRISGTTSETLIHPAIICFIGLVAVTSFASVLSLFFPLGTWPVQLLILSPSAMFIFFKDTRATLSNVKKIFHDLHFASIILLCLCLLLIVVMSTWYIDNQDTLAYHAPITQWIEKYKAVPGIANLHVRYGLQSFWFISCALFSFSFLKLQAFTFINTAVLFWYLIFITYQINKSFSERKSSKHAFFWISILIVSLLSYTQVRLAATSGNPDFITTLYIWLSFYFLVDNKGNDLPDIFLPLIIIISCFTLALKLSAIPIIILAVYCAYRLISKKKIRLLAISVVICLTIFVSLVSRNIISSGYPIYPSPVPDIANVDWKLDKQLTLLVRDYVTSYARTKAGATKEEINKIVSMPVSNWLPTWWGDQSLVDKIILIGVAFSIIALLINIRKISRSNQLIKISLVTSLLGTVFWFIKAPDPRFGFGFIMMLPILLALLHNNSVSNKNEKISAKALLPTTVLISIFIIAYIGYRIMNFFSFQQLVSPKGIKEVEYKTINCSGIMINIPAASFSCGSISSPCAYDSCRTFQPRGKSITDGFKPK